MPGWVAVQWLLLGFVEHSHTDPLGVIGASQGFALAAFTAVTASALAMALRLPRPVDAAAAVGIEDPSEGRSLLLLPAVAVVLVIAADATLAAEMAGHHVVPLLTVACLGTLLHALVIVLLRCTWALVARFVRGLVDAGHLDIGPKPIRVSSKRCTTDVLPLASAWMGTCWRRRGPPLATARA